MKVPGCPKCPDGTLCDSCWLDFRHALHDAEVRRRNDDEFNPRGCLIALFVCIAIWAIGFIGIFYS